MADEKPKQSHDELNSSESSNTNGNSLSEPVAVQSKTDINSSARSLRYQSRCIVYWHEENEVESASHSVC